jgi:sugar (pentulose or hexulose) kinase
METLYVACDLGAERGQISLGNLNNGRLRLSDIRRFPNQPTPDGDELHWDIPNLYHNLVEGLSEVGRSYETVNGISCSSWGHDYMLFDSDGSLMTPTFAQPTPRARATMDEILSQVTCETIFDETGFQPAVQSALFQLGVEKSRRLNKADRLLPVADGFNYLLSGEARVEASSAGTTQLFNPYQRAWSKRLLGALRLPARIFPPVCPSGTVLGPLRQDLAEQAKLEDARIVSSCSHELASTIVGLPAPSDGKWAFLKPGSSSFMGVELPEPIISATARELDFANEIGYGGTTRFLKQTAGLWMLEECRRAWAGTERDLDLSVMMHLAAQSPPFESLINPMDLRFMTPGDMPLKVKEFCKETEQPVPRKPGPVIRCILESVALYYRKTLREIEELTKRRIEQLYLLGDNSNPLFNSFITNALQIPVVIIPEQVTVIGNMLVQGIALKHIESLEEARQIVRDSFKFETLHPHAEIWNSAYKRLQEYTGVF